jgi:hypothetical protein
MQLYCRPRPIRHVSMRSHQRCAIGVAVHTRHAEPGCRQGRCRQRSGGWEGGPSAHSKSMMHGKPWSLTRIVSGRSARNTIFCCDAMRFAQPMPRPAARWQMQPRSPVQMWTAVGGPDRAYLVDAVEERDEVRDVDAREALVQLKLRTLSAVCCLPHVVCR